ncbi:hypothetical protein [Microbispora catharanthi]|uniref:Uncharacterized protein n=1 Tax=Microbispora catharanthi TaxID=1712871 RepID=A0A5N6BVM9_9ACTN|nr:hypothetical protein [Microbispora catharanthi]KAB8184501.1 hypothetical protein FH610_015445 [Microbispora catharanthi]
MSHARLPLHIAFWMPVPPFATLMVICCVPRLVVGLVAVSPGWAASLSGRAGRSPDSWWRGVSRPWVRVAPAAGPAAASAATTDAQASRPRPIFLTAVPPYR